MIAAIMQPTYLSWIGYFDLIDQVDRFVFLDDAQVLKRSWGVRNRVLGSNGEAFLTVPLVGHSQKADCSFVNTAVDTNPKWRRTHLATVEHAYAKTPFFDEVFEALKALLSGEHETIGALNRAFIEDTARRIGIATELCASSDMEGLEGAKDARLVSICEAIGAQTYLSAQGSAAYIEQEHEGGAFAGSPVALRYHQYAHPTYAQNSDEFVSHMSIVDMLMHTGYEAALELIRSGRRPMLTSAELKEMA